MKHLLFLICLLIATPYSTKATNHKVDETLAVQAAKKQFALFQKLDSKGFRSLQPFVKQVKTTNDTVTYYVVAFRNRPGFAVIAGSSLVKPIIAISSKDVFDTSTIPPPMAYLLRVNERRVLRAIRAENKMPEVQKQQQEWDLSDPIFPVMAANPDPYFDRDSVGPLMTTIWGQGGYYNQKCPYHGPACDNGHADAGCGPVAMAQVMRYHEHPDNYNWANMPDALTATNNDVANLIRDCGESAGTNYTCIGSSTFPSDIDDAMRYGFDYPGTTHESITIYFNTEPYMRWNIYQGFPIIYSGFESWNPADWHIFVADGYKWINDHGWLTVYHINWGWEGTYNDIWFCLDGADPPGDPGPYNSSQAYISPLSPPGNVTVESPVAGSVHLSKSEFTVKWTSTGKAGTLDSVMIIMFWPFDGYGKPYHYVNGCYIDTIRGIPNSPGLNQYTFMLPSQPMLSDTIFEYLQVTAYGKYKYYSEEVPLKIAQGEHSNFVSPVQSTVYQSNMPNLVQWSSNPNSSSTYNLWYMKKGGPGLAISDTIFTHYTGRSFNWVIPSNLEGQYYLELERISDPYERIYSETFTIGPPAEISITQPVANSRHEPGNTMNILWTSNYTGPVKIKVFRLYDWAGSDTIVVAASTPNDGSYDWIIPTDIEPGTLYTMTIEGAGNSQVKAGTGCFTIKTKISLVAPANNMDWEMTTDHLIEWTDNIAENVDIKLYQGTTYLRSIALDTPSDGSYQWSVPSDLIPGSGYRVRISQNGDESVSAYSSYFTISIHRYIEITAPDGWSEWQKGLSHNIKWNTNIGNVNIKLIDISANPKDTTVIANNVIWNAAGYAWTIPTSFVNWHLYKILISGVLYHDVVAITDIFKITNPPSISVTYPNSGSHWATGTLHTISWTDSIPGFVDITLYNRATGLIVQTITSSTESDGNYSWTIPATLTPGTQYYLVVRSLDHGSLVQDASDDFEITQGDYILVTSPTFISQWEAGSTHFITWNDNITSNVRIILKKPSLGIRDTIVSSTLSNGSYRWTIPADQIPATNYNILIESTANSAINDLSDPFEIYSATGNYITVMSPTADSSMKKGTQHLISWRDNISGGLHVDLYLNNVLVQVISAYATGTSLLWTVPTTLANGNKYQVKIYSGVTYDFSENFKILPADYIDYTGPGAFRMGETSNITWTDNISGPVKIDLLLADTLFRTLSGSTESDGSYAWTPPSDLPAETWYKIRISRVGAPALSDVSSPVPVYYTYYIDITSPEAGNFLLQGSEYAIQWNENFSNGESFRIDLFKNGDSIRQITAYNLPSYKLWQLNVLYADLPQGDDYTIRVKCNDKPAVFDFSSPFAIMNCDSLDFSIGRDTTMLTTGEIDLVAPDGYQFYFWTPVQNSGRIDHIPGSYFSPGNYQAICMAIHESGCIRKDTLILTVEYPPCLADANFFAENAEGTGICNTFTFRNTGMVPANCRMTWDFGDGTTMDTLSTAINHTFPGPGQYIVSCTVTDASIAGCSNSHIDTIVIQPPPDILLTHTFAADSGLFIASITGPGNYRIVWKIDSIPVDNMLNREGYQSDSLIWVFPDNGNYRIEMIVQDTISACTYSYVEDLVVSSIPPCHKTKGYFSTQPAFGYDTGDRSTFLFKGGVNELLPCSTYSFNLGDGTIITDTLQFVHRYASPGMYVATMTITDCAACSFTWKDTICAYSDFVSGLQPDVTGCDSTTLNATPGMSYYQWNDNTNNSFLKVTSNGQYWLLVADGLGYYLEDTTTVTIYPRTAVSLAPFPVICSNEGTYFLLGGQPFGGVYTGEFVSGEIFNVSASGPGFFEVRYHLPYLQGCSDTAYQIIEVEPISGAGTLYLQNIIQTDSAYFAGDSVLIGSTVTGSLPEGPYIVQSGAEVFVKAGNSLIMKPGTSINAGSHFMGVIMPLNCVTDSFVKALAETDAAIMNTASKIMLGPNPTSGRTSLYISQGSFEGYHLHVFNSSGIRIMEQSNHTGKMINLDFEGLHEGLYFIRLWNENTAMTFKLVKN